MSRRPRLVLVHGTRFDATMWDGYADLIPAADIATPELPGHGERAGQPWTLDAALAVIDDEVRRARELEQPVILAGHSLGGYLATMYAERHPDALSALVLIGATADPSRHPQLTKIYTGFATLLARVGPTRMARISDAVMRALGASGSLPDSSGYAVVPAAWRTVIDEARVAQLAGVNCPVFLVAGQFDQMRIDLRAYAAVHGGAEVHLIRRATHLAPLTHRLPLAALLRSAVATSVAQSS